MGIRLFWGGHGPPSRPLPTPIFTGTVSRFLVDQALSAQVVLLKYETCYILHSRYLILLVNYKVIFRVDVFIDGSCFRNVLDSIVALPCFLPHNRVDRGNLVLRHSISNTPPNVRDELNYGGEINSAFFLLKQEKYI